MMRPGLLLRVGGEVRLLPASVALRVVATPAITRVPGGPPQLLGIALHEGAVVSVIALGPAGSTMVICQYAGENLGLVGAEVLDAGTFGDAAVARDLDIEGIYNQVRHARGLA
jgi:chemotaxis signal transduction protein